MNANMAYGFTETELDIARHTDLPDLLSSLGYTLKRVGSYYTTAEMDSIRIKERHTWRRYSTRQKVIIRGGESKTLTFQNEPLNGIVVEKYDSVTGEALPGCTFQLRYLGGTSGTGGTVIGQKVTGKNGTCIWTGLTAGTYIVEVRP